METKTLDLQLVQNNTTDFIVYDDSNRGYNPTPFVPAEAIKDIQSILVTFTSTLIDPNPVVIELAAVDSTLHDGFVYVDFTKLQYQSEFAITIPSKLFTVDCDILPEGKWTVSFAITHPTYIVEAATLIEYSFKQTEIYREQLFLHIARNVGVYNPYYNNYMTERDKFRMQVLYFDANFKAFKTQLEVGNTIFADKTLKWLQEFRLMNPINLILQTND